MPSRTANTTTGPRITELRVKNFRALKDLKLTKITPLTVLLGPNGSGKSTVFDVFAFLSECFEHGLRGAWDKRGKMRELRSREEDGPIEIEIKYREQGFPLVTYHLSVDQEKGSPVVVAEWLSWTRGQGSGRPFRFLDSKNGVVKVISGEKPESEDERKEVRLKSRDLLAVNALGQLADHPRVVALRDFITGWYVSYLSAADARGYPEAGPQEHLSRTGDNLANVIQYLSEQHSEQLDSIFETLRRRIPRIDHVLAEPMADGRMLLQIKDGPFKTPILARNASDGTLKMLAYLVVLHDPAPPPFIGIEEPENFLHPRLLRELAEECRAATARTQLFATTHSPFLLDTLKADEVRVLWRNKTGFTEAQTLSEIDGITKFIDNGAALGDLWMEGHFGVGDPLTRSGGPARKADER